MALNNKKILKNSAIVYIRLIVTMLINLYTSRIVLEQLGVTDFGTYNIVAGITALFSSIKTLFSSAIQRYYNYEIGYSNSPKKINTIFCLGFYIHLIFAIILTISLEIVGIWLLNNKLDIPIENFETAKWLFQMSVIGTILSMLSVPFNAMIIAREKIGFFAILSITPSNHFILYCPLFLLPSVFPSIRVFSNELALCIKWPKYWSFSFSISPSNEYSGLISFRMDWLDLPAVQGTL